MTVGVDTPQTLAEKVAAGLGIPRRYDPKVQDATLDARAALAELVCLAEEADTLRRELPLEHADARFELASEVVQLRVRAVAAEREADTLRAELRRVGAARDKAREAETRAKWRAAGGQAGRKLVENDLATLREAADYALAALSAENYDGESKVRYAAWKKLRAALDAASGGEE